MEEVLISLDDGEGLVLSAPGNYVLRAGTRGVVARGVPLSDMATTSTKWGGIVIRSSDVHLNLNGNWVRAESNAHDFAAVVVESGAHEVTIRNGTVGRCTSFGVLVLPGTTAVTLSSLRVRDFGLGAIGFFGVPPGAGHSVAACTLGPNFFSGGGGSSSSTSSVVGVLVDGTTTTPSKSTTTALSVSISDVDISGLRARPRQATDLVVLGVPAGGERALSDSLGRGLEQWPLSPVDGVQKNTDAGGQQAQLLSSCRCCCYAAATNLGNCTSPTFPKLNGGPTASYSYSVTGLDESGAAIFGVAGVLVRNLSSPYLVSSVHVSSSSARRASLLLPTAEKKSLSPPLPVLGSSRPIFEVRSLIWAGTSDPSVRGASSILGLTGDDGVKGPVFLGSPAHPMDAETLAHLCRQTSSSSSCHYSPAWVPHNSISGRPGGQSSMTLARPVGNIQNALDRLEFLPDVFLCPPTLP